MSKPHYKSQGGKQQARGGGCDAPSPLPPMPKSVYTAKELIGSDHMMGL